MDDVVIARTALKDWSSWDDDSVVQEYERTFARWNGSVHASAFMSGREALSACIYALGLKSGDEVIVPGYTCVVVPNAFHYEGIRSVYCDIELETFGPDAQDIERKITGKTRAILLQHLYGLVCRDYLKILELARKKNLRVIEDCAHATGAKFDGINVGNFGDVAFYSSEQSKVFNTIQGGIAVSNSESIKEKLQEFRDEAKRPSDALIEKQLYNVLLNYYKCKHRHRWLMGDFAELLYGRRRLVSTTKDEEQGRRPAYYGRKMAAPIAKLGLNQLGKIDMYNEKRRQAAKRWALWCDERNVKKPTIIDRSIPVHLRYPVMVPPEKKTNTSWALRDPGVTAGVWFVSQLHPIERTVKGCPNAETAVKQCINLPCLGATNAPNNAGA